MTAVGRTGAVACGRLLAVPLLICQRTGSLAYSGIAYAIESVPALIAYPFAGLFADRLGGCRPADETRSSLPPPPQRLPNSLSLVFAEYRL
ncbi:hypothetical protein [Burkholderia vietnamiensis]|uniref:hypothetical protein n=1 Tax=Burkholderia vietnamiensis TaxID=60552 RepID=UPI00075A2C74|nr:hypothetical protein [Burkholderia vietnamiensis]KVF01140.1 hypothetical protein WJ03_08150 [Burkholderia vietnamiensis]